MKKENLIQIIGYRKFHNETTGKIGIRQHHFANIDVTSSTKLFKNLEKIINLIPETERYDVHYTNAYCTPVSDNFGLRNFHSQDMIPIDLDKIDLNKKDEYINLIFKVTKADPAKTGIFCSGNGLHFVIVLEHKFDISELKRLQPYYKELCKVINIEIFNSGLTGEADSVRFAESATLRLPLTENRKDENNPKQTYIIQGNVAPQEWDLSSLFSIPEKEKLKQDDSAYIVDAPAVLSGCDFLKHCKENPNKIKEPEWFAMIGTLAYIPGTGENLCHTYSKDHNDYNESETQSKYEQAKNLGKPRTCQGIDQIWNRCSECKFFNKVKTPLQIKSESFISTQKDGFHFVEFTKSGTKYTPDYHGLVNFFGQEKPFINIPETRITMQYTGKKWEEIHDSLIQAFATTHFNPVATNLKRSEFFGLVKSRNVTYVQGSGKLISSNTVEANGTKYTGKNVILATGSYPKTLPGLEIDGKQIITSEQAIKLDYVPKSVIVLGGGVIGCEFASVWKSFGAEVTIIEGLNHLVALEDESSSKQLERAFRKRGINFELGVKFKSAERSKKDVKVTLEDGKEFSAEILLVAVGRGPVSAGLGYEEAGIKMDRGYVLVDNKCRTNVPGVWAVGDLIPTLQLAHVGFAEGIMVAEEIAGLNPRAINYDGIPRVTYSEPEVASVGLTTAAAKAAGNDVVELNYDLAGNGKANILKTAGSVKLVAKKNGPVLGIHMVGSRVGELLAEAQLIYNWEADAADVAQHIHAHPTLSEAMGEAHLALAGKPLHAHG